MSKRILLVDDEPEILKSLRMILEYAGYQISTASSGNQALASMEGELPQLVFLDIKMPHMDGMTVLKEIAAQWPSIPVVMISGHGTIETALEATRLGAFDFLVQRGVQAEKVGVLGYSMGAATALLGVAEEPAIRAVVADSSYADISDLIAQETARETPFPEWMVPVFVPGMDLMAGLFFDVDIGAMIPQEAVARLDYPVLLVHGTADERIPVDSSVRIHLASHPDSSLWLVDGVGHTDAFDERPDEYVEKVVSYFESRLGGE